MDKKLYIVKEGSLNQMEIGWSNDVLFGNTQTFYTTK